MAKEYKCKVCGQLFVKTFSSTQKVCSPECAIKLARDNAQKAQERAEKKKQRERKAKLKSRSEWLKEAQSVFNKFIRLRDKDQPCISCGRCNTMQGIIVVWERALNYDFVISTYISNAHPVMTIRAETLLSTESISSIKSVQTR